VLNVGEGEREILVELRGKPLKSKKGCTGKRGNHEKTKGGGAVPGAGKVEKHHNRKGRKEGQKTHARAAIMKTTPVPSRSCGERMERESPQG